MYSFHEILPLQADPPQPDPDPKPGNGGKGGRDKKVDPAKKIGKE